MNATAKRNELKGARGGLILIVAVGVIAAATAWFLHNFHRVEHEFPLPPRGEAAYNPLYALRRTLEADGVRAESRQRLDLSGHAPAPRDTLLFYADPRTLSPADAERLLDWVEAGGHLILRTPQGSDWSRDLATPVFAELGLLLLDEDSRGCVPFQVEGENSHVEFCRGRRFGFDDTVPELAWGDLKNGYVYARLAHGEGHVDVLADMDFLVNGSRGGDFDIGDMLSGNMGGGEGLRDVPHQVLARQVLAPNYGRGTMHLVYSAQVPSLWRMLLARGWPVWTPLALALFAWLWRRARRFGPLRPAPALERRSLLEHVRASGEHLFRYRRGVLLYAAARQAFFARLRRRDPLAASLEGEAQIALLAERFKLSADTLRRALQTPASHDKVAFRDRISLLIELRNRL